MNILTSTILLHILRVLVEICLALALLQSWVAGPASNPRNLEESGIFLGLLPYRDDLHQDIGVSLTAIFFRRFLRPQGEM
jgi:hypothetical protein